LVSKEIQTISGSMGTSQPILEWFPPLGCLPYVA